MRVSRFLAAGLFVVAAVLFVEAQPPGGGFGFGQQSLFSTVLTNKALQEELKVTDAQKEKFKALAEKNAEASKKRGESYKEKFADAQGDQDKVKDLFSAMQKEFQKDGEATAKAVEEMLTSEQVKRIKQIDRQRGGVGAFVKDDNIKALGMSDEQKSKIKTIVDEYRKDVQEVRKSSGGSFKDGKFTFDKEKFEAGQVKEKKLTKAAQGDIDEVLTDDQKKMWKEMLGEPFDTTKLFAFPGGFPGKGKDKEKTKD